MIINFIVLPDHLEICTRQFATGAGASARIWCPSTAANCSNIWDGSSSRVSFECNSMSFCCASSFECRIILFGRIKLWMALCDGLWRYYNERITNTSIPPRPGLSGDRFQFDEYGDGPARYDLIHFKQVSPGRYRWQRIGEYHSGQLKLDTNGIYESPDKIPCVTSTVISLSWLASSDHRRDRLRSLQY
jgi:hypothetical protein